MLSRLSRAFILLLLCSTLVPIVQAGECLIQSGPSRGLVEYEGHLTTTLTKLEALGAKAGGCKEGKSQSREAFARINASLNKDFSLSTLITDFRYQMEGVETSEPRLAVVRDEKWLYSLEKRIITSIEVAGLQCALDTLVDETTRKGLSSVAPPPGTTISEIYDALIQNHKDISRLYKHAAFGENIGLTKFSLVSPGFASDILASYNPVTTAACLPTSGESSTESVTARIMETISGRGARTQEGLAAWKDAIALLQNNYWKTNDLALERKLLSAELARQGVGGRGAAIILSNLDHYNQGSARGGDDDSRLTRAWNNIITGVKSDIDPALGTLLQKSPNTEVWMDRYRALKYRPEILIPIQQDYVAARALLADEAQTDQELIQHLLDLHIRLLETNAELEKTIPRAARVCDRQLPGYGNCQNYD